MEITKEEFLEMMENRISNLEKVAKARIEDKAELVKVQVEITKMMLQFGALKYGA